MYSEDPLSGGCTVRKKQSYRPSVEKFFVRADPGYGVEQLLRGVDQIVQYIHQLLRLLQEIQIDERNLQTALHLLNAAKLCLAKLL